MTKEYSNKRDSRAALPLGDLVGYTIISIVSLRSYTYIGQEIALLCVSRTHIEPLDI